MKSDKENQKAKGKRRKAKVNRQKVGTLSLIFDFYLLPFALCLLIFAFCLLPFTKPMSVTSQTADSWPQFRGNYNLTGISQSQPPADLKLLWTYDAGEIIESSAAIVEGTVYVGTGKSELIAVDLSSGKLKWKYQSKEDVGESSPAFG
ncbi:PQQ-binding-like beta-propeller repeat protein, partial [candidate division KSB1 bacterium]|nr:PQQ-binding-like beta-propeller repeat protein [candidate division KSB1 bacterium]